MLAWQGCSGFLILELDLPQPCLFKVHCFGKLCSDPKVVITIPNVFGTGLWEWPPGLGVDSWEEPQSQWWQEWHWLLIASWMRALVTGGIRAFAVKAHFIHKKCFRIGKKANYRATDPISPCQTHPEPSESPCQAFCSLLLWGWGSGASSAFCAYSSKTAGQLDLLHREFWYVFSFGLQEAWSSPLQFWFR